MTGDALGVIQRARSAVERERRELRAERRALERFSDAVTSLDASPVSTAPANAAKAPPATGGLVVPSGDTRVEQVRTRYRETLMAVPHYEDAYGECFEANVRAEFGDDVADALTADGRTAFTPALKQALLSATRTATTERVEFVTSLAAETTSLNEAANALGSVATALDDAEPGSLNASRVAALLDELDAVAAARQQHLHASNTGGHTDRHLLCTYLYDDLPWTYPVLHAVSVLRETLDERRRRTA